MEQNWLLKNPMGEDIGYGRKFETMVFLAGKPCSESKCNCGLPEISGGEYDTVPSNDRKAAMEGHMRMCLRYSQSNMQNKKPTH